MRPPVHFGGQPVTGSWDTGAVHIARLPAADSDEHYELHLAAVEHELASPIIIESRDDILSHKHWAGRVEPFEHQIKNLITFCRRAPVALIADDVGLGKTVSAGLILNELQTRRRVRRALILCPKVMLDQWKEELESKFGMPDIARGVGQELTAILQRPPAVVVTTYESAKDRMDLIRQAGFDMLVLDEAHKLRNLHGTQSPPKLAKAVHDALEQRTFRYVLMLSATPIQNRLWDIYSLIQCLSVAKGHKNPLGEPAAFASQYLDDGATSARQLIPARRDEFRRKLQDYMVRTSRGTAGLSFPERLLKSVSCRPTPQEASLQELVGEIMEPLSPLARVSVAEALLSSPRALLAQLRNMVENGTIDDEEVAELVGPIQACGRGCKLDRVLKLCRELRSESPASWRMLIFTRRKETLGLIEEALVQEGIPVGVIHGGYHNQNQRAIKGFWQDPPACNVIVSTDAGAVGLNLQVGNVIVNYDLPWNPMILEQRIGRVQRLGSKFHHVVVWNLSVEGSIEDLIVSRLLEKLHAVAETLGDIESVLEASSWGDNDAFEQELRTLVTQALMGMDVRESMERAKRSIDRARAIYEEEREAVEQNLGALDAMHEAGPKVPKLAPKIPRFDVPTFCRKAFASEGATLQDLDRDRLRIEVPGRASWVAVFDEDDPDLAVSESLFGSARTLLYQEGSPHFERLTGEWRKRHAHRVLDRVADSHAALPELLRQWVERFDCGVGLAGFEVRDEVPCFRGHVVVRGSAAVSHDRYEKLVVSRVAKDGHAEMIVPPAEQCRPPREVAFDRLEARAQGIVRSAVESDPDIVEFTKFYDARQREELERAKSSAGGRRDVADRFATSLAAEVVGLAGDLYAELLVDARFGVPGEEPCYRTELRIVPLAQQILSEPERAPCEITGTKVPATWLGSCSKSGKRVLAHMLLRSAVSGRLALAEFFVTCAVSGRAALAEETGESVLSGVRVCRDLLVASAVSGRTALATEMEHCAFTTASVLPEELVESAVSGKRGRRDQIVQSAVSGVLGHESELVRCEVTNDLMLPSEAGRTSIDGKLVRRDLLCASEKSPQRVGVADQLVVCSVTGKRLLQDEAVQSSVSGQWIDYETAAWSAESGQPARPDELVACEVSGAKLLPSECAKSSVSGRTVDRRLLHRSEVSGRSGLEEEVGQCDFTGAVVLAKELLVSEVSGKKLRCDELIRSAASGVGGHRSEFVKCQETGDWLRPSESAASEVSGKIVAERLLQASDRPPHRRCLPSEGRRCEVSGRFLLPDEVGRSVVSKRLVDTELLVASSVSGARMLREEAVTCALSGQTMLPIEAGYSELSGRATDARRLRRSDVSGVMLLEDEVGTCEVSGVTAALEELVASEASARRVRRDQVVASAVSGKRAHESEMVRCAVTGGFVLPAEAGTSSLSGSRARKDLLQASAQNPGRFGLPDEFETCSVSGLRLLKDEVVASALSGKLMNRAVSVASQVSGRIGLPSEAVKCEESGVTVLRDEAIVCAASGKRVDRRLVEKSDITGRVGVARLLSTCPETGKRGFEDEFRMCEVTGLRVAADALTTCSLTGTHAVERLMVVCAISGQRLLRDRAVWSARSSRPARPEHGRICEWTGQQLLVDEVHTCPVSGLLFSNLIPIAWAAEPLVQAVAAGIPKQVLNDAASLAVAALLGAAGRPVRGLRLLAAPRADHVAFFADVSGMFGLRKRHALGMAKVGANAALLGTLAVARWEGGQWS
jgi:superfamily II DNA or RNA helicase